MEFGGNVLPDCPSAGNPYHECTAKCFERIDSSHGKKEKKLLGSFGMKTPSHTPPGSPARFSGAKSPLPSYYFSKGKVESDDAPSFASSDENTGYVWKQPSPARFQPSHAKPVSGNRTPDRRRGETPGDRTPRSPFREGRSPPPYHYAEKRAESDAPSFSSSEENTGYVWKQASPMQDQPSQTKPVPGNSAAVQNNPLTLSPSLAVYFDRGEITRTPDRRKGETPSYPSNVMESRSRPTTPEPRHRHPEPRSRTPEPWSRTPDVRPRTPEHRPRTPEHRPRTPEHRPRTPEHRPRTPEPQSRTSETGPVSPRPQPKTPKPLDFGAIPSANHFGGPRSPKVSFSPKKKAESAYSDDDEESVLLYPEALLSPEPKAVSRPTTPDRHRVEMLIGEPLSKQEDPKMKAESVDSDGFSFREDLSIYLYPELVSPSRPKSRSGSSTPVHHKFQPPSEQEDYEKNYELLDGSQGFSLLEIEKMRAIKNCDKDEMQSVISESFVSIWNYKVRLSVSSTLQSILDKYGDIASGSKLQSLSTRSYYLDSLSSVVLELKSTPLEKLIETRVNEILALVKDMESVKIQVGWLRGFLNELLEAVKYFSQHIKTVSEKETCDRDLEVARKEIEAKMKQLGLKEKDLKECKEQVTEIGGRLGHLEMKRSRLTKNLTFLKAKVEKFQGKSVLDELL